MNMKDINYASLYGVLPGESDFLGAIKRSLKNDVKHLDEFMKMIKNNERLI